MISIDVKLFSELDIYAFRNIEPIREWLILQGALVGEASRKFFFLKKTFMDDNMELMIKLTLSIMHHF